MDGFENLFVYGSLMQGQNGGALAARLSQQARFLGPATCPGRLYLIDWYPGLVPADDGSQVQGELYALPSGSDLWAALDRYEGIGEDFPHPQEYLRRRLRVRCDARPVPAWVYVYNWSVADKALIENGKFSST